MSQHDPDELLTQEAAAEFLGLKPRFLEKRRVEGTGPQYVKISKRCVRYRRRDLLDWVEAHLQKSTSAA